MNHPSRFSEFGRQTGIWALAITVCAALASGQIGCKMDDCTRCTDDEPPQVVSTYPADGDTSIAVDTAVTATFSELMDPWSVSASLFTLEGPDGPVAAAMSLTGLTATLTPAEQLIHSSVYTARIDANIRDAAGNKMGTPYSWSFTTAGP